MQTNYSQIGTYTAVAGFIVSVLGHFNISTNVADVVQIIGAAVVLFGIIKQSIDHKKLAVATGAYPLK